MISRTDSKRPIEPFEPLDKRLRASLIAVALCGVALTLATLVVSGSRATLSVAVGAAVAAGNLWVLARIVMALLPDERRSPRAHPSTPVSLDSTPARGAGAWAVLAVLKMFGLFAFVWLLMRYSVVSPLPMLVGFGALPVGIAIGSLVSDRSAPTEP